MFDHIIDTYLYTGQPTSDWPKWLIFTNFARSNDGSRVVIPYLWHTVEVNPGDLLVLTATRDVHAVKPVDQASVEIALANAAQPD